MTQRRTGQLRRQQILDEAQQLFNRQGYRETNLDDVAVKLGFKRQAIYYYFKSKEDVLWELVERASSTLTASAAAIFEADLDAESKLSALIDNHVRQLLSDPEIFRLDVLQRDKLSPERHEVVRDAQRVYVRRWTEIIAEGQKEGLFVKASPPHADPSHHRHGELDARLVPTRRRPDHRRDRRRDGTNVDDGAPGAATCSGQVAAFEPSLAR